MSSMKKKVVFVQTPNPLCLNRVINISSCRKLNSGQSNNMQMCRFLCRMAISG